MEVRRTVGVVTAVDVEFLTVDFYQCGEDATGGVCGGCEDEVREGGGGCVEEVV